MTSTSLVALRRILLVSGHTRSREAYAEGLLAAGHEVLEVVSTDEALSAFESRSDLRLLVTDRDTPGSLSGIELARFSRRRWPQIFGIIIGWPPAPMPSLPSGITFVLEHCAPEALVDHVLAIFRSRELSPFHGDYAGLSNTITFDTKATS